jgi:hypothetical protein
MLYELGCVSVERLCAHDPVSACGGLHASSPLLKMSLAQCSRASWTNTSSSRISSSRSRRA